MYKLSFLLIVASIFSSPAIAAADLDQAAVDVCQCLEEPHKQVKKAVAMIMEGKASGNMTQITSAQSEMMAVFKASAQCFESLSQKYPDINNSDELKKEVMARANQNCPSPVPELSQMR